MVPSRIFSAHKLPGTFSGAFAIKTFTKGRVQMTVRLLMDNMSAAHYINKMGGTKSPVLARLTLDLWDWCLEHKIVVEAKYLPVILNTRAGKESRVMLDRHDWKLDPKVFSTIHPLWGPLEVDLFASRLTTQLPRFYSWRPDPLAEASDAFSQDWSKVRGYAFPPFAQVGRCLKQLVDQNVSRLVLVAPLWQSQPWYPLLLQNCIATPVLLPHYQGLLTRQTEMHPLDNLKLAGWLLSANPTLKQEFLSQLKSCCWQHGAKAQPLPMLPLGENGIAGVVGDKLIQFMPQ